MNNEQRLDYVLGQVAALKAFCVSSIIANPNPADLLTHFGRASEITTSKMLPTQASEAMMDGIEKMNDDLLAVLQQEVARKGSVAR